MLRGIGVAVDSGVVVPVHQVVGAVGHGLDGHVGTGHHSVGGVGHDGADAVDAIGTATVEDHLADAGGAAAEGDGVGVAFPDGEGAARGHCPAVGRSDVGFGTIASRSRFGHRHLDAGEVVARGADGEGRASRNNATHDTNTQVAIVVKQIGRFTAQEGDVADGFLNTSLVGPSSPGLAVPDGGAAQLHGHLAAVVMDEGEGVGSEDHSGEVGAVVGHDAAVVDHVDGGSAGGVDAERLRIEGVGEAHHIGVAGAETEEARAGILEGIHVGVKELIVRREDEFGDSIHLEAVVGAEGVAVGQGFVVVLPSQLRSVLGEGGADGLVLRHGEAGGAVAVVGHVAAPALEVVVHLGRGLDGESAVVINNEGVKGGVGRDYAVEAVSGGVVEFETFIIGVGDVIADVAYGDVELLLHAVLELYSDVSGAFVSVEDIGCPGGDVGAAQGAGLFAADGLVVGQVDVGVGDEGQGGAAHAVQRQGAAVVVGEGQRGLGLEVGGEGFGGDDAVVGFLDGDVAVGVVVVVAEADEVVLGVGGGHDGDRGAVVYIICIRSAGSDDVALAGAGGEVDHI